MTKKSAGLVLYRFKDSQLEVFLVHPGGPFWSKKDEGAWSITKGEYEEGEDPFEVAKRELKEETGYEASGDFISLSPLKQPSRKIIIAWALEGDCDADKIKNNTFMTEWPPCSGKHAEFPEVDRAAWFSIHVAKRKILKGQVGFVEELCEKLGYDPYGKNNFDKNHDGKDKP
jgi:predicted NUDIX family NTP pyrophosphohydrolase